MAGTRWRDLGYSLAAVPLAWFPWLLAEPLRSIGSTVTSSGLSLLAKRLLLTALDPVLLALLYLLGCWVVWKLAVSKATWLRWIAVSLAAAQTLTLLSTLAMFFLTPPGAPVDAVLTDTRLYAGWLLPPALTMLAVATYSEPHTTSRLRWQANAAAWALAAVAVVAWALSANDSAPWWFRVVLNVPHRVSIWPVQLAYLGTAGLLASAEMPTAVAVPAAQVLWVGGFWYVAGRIAASLVTQHLDAGRGT